MITIYALTALLNLTTSVFLGVFVYTRDPKSAINRAFGLFCLSIAVWSGAYFLWQISGTAEQALLWVRVLTAGSIFVAISYFHFTLAFLNKLKGKMRYLLSWGYPIFVFFFLVNFTPLMVANVTPKLQFNFWPNPGTLYHPFLAIWVFFILLTLFVLFREHFKVTGLLRTQIHYILLGTIVGYLGGVTNYFLWYDIPIPPLGNWTTTFYLGIVAYAIVKQQLFDIRVVLTELLVGVTGVLLLINVFTSQTPFEYAWKTVLFVAFLFSGYLLIKSVLREIQYREELQKTYEELRRLDEAKSEFISIASHQLRTPLTAIKGYISLMLEGTYGKITGASLKPLKNVYQSNERLIKLVNNLLNLSRLEAGRIKMAWEAVQVQDITQSVLEELEVKAQEKGITLRSTKPKTKLPTVMGDNEKIRNVIMNLVDNAIRYTEKGGITVTSKMKDAKTLRIEVRDTGAGIEPDEIKELFKSFSRGGAGNTFWTEGTGLGLYVAKQFVDMHKGKIWAESPGRGKGSTFFIELPIRKMTK